MKAILTKKEDAAEGTMYTEFITEEEIKFAPGQFFRLSLINPIYTDNRGNSRFFGFINTPSQVKLAATITRNGPSAFKRSMFEALPGMEAEIDGINGNIVFSDDLDKVIVIVTGGIGVAPIMSLLRWENQESRGHKILLINSNTNRKRAIFLEELREYEHAIPNFKLEATMTQDPDWGGETRRIDADYLKEKINLGEDNMYYITGTPRFVPDMVKHLRGIGADPAKMKFEIFTGY